MRMWHISDAIIIKLTNNQENFFLYKNLCLRANLFINCIVNSLPFIFLRLFLIFFTELLSNIGVKKNQVLKYLFNYFLTSSLGVKKLLISSLLLIVVFIYVYSQLTLSSNNTIKGLIRLDVAVYSSLFTKLLAVISIFNTTSTLSTIMFFALVLYFLVVSVSFFLMFFLNLRGIFFLTNCALSIFWVSLILNIKNFFFYNLKFHYNLFKWFKLNDHTQIFFELYVDNISFSFMLLTTTIAIFVNFYAFSYFRAELNVEKFILFLNMFVLSMLLLVSSGNLIVCFLGWELIGITSFFLINFWFNRATTFKSAFKAYTFNKFSDCCIFFALILLVNITKTSSFIVLLNSNFFVNEVKNSIVCDINTIELISFFFLTAAFIKSAQIGFHIWLPDSMEAPVPASALIHSATLVSAGIFLILRLYPFFELSNYFFFIISLVGSATAFLGGISASMQTDLKKILAYSTISHCGFLIFLTSFNNTGYVLLYLFIHGFFKAGAFLSVGNIIRFSKGYQDIRRMGQYWKYLTGDLFFLTFAMLNLSGLPFFFGFYIKHFLFLNNDYLFFKSLCSIFLFLGALSGVFYSFKIIYYVFFDTKKARKSIYLNDNTKHANSFYYTNSTLAAHIAIFFLFIFGYLFSGLFFYYYFSKNFFDADFNSFILKVSDLFYFSENTSTFFNFKFLNWVILMLLLFLIFFKWNKFFSIETSIGILTMLFCFFFFINIIFL